AGEQAEVSAQSTAVEKANGKSGTVEAATAWTQGRLVFQGTPLQEVAAEFNRYNARRLVVQDPELANLRVTGIFSSTDPSSLIRFLETRPEIDLTQTPDEIHITRKHP